MLTNSISIRATETAGEIIHLAECILATHTSEGDQSPLASHRIAQIMFKMNAAKAKYEEAIKIANEITKLEHMITLIEQERDEILGIGQANTTPSTSSLKYYLNLIREELLEAGRKKENYLEKWGFKA